MFSGFTSAMIDTGEATIRVRHGGSGPPVLLLHGHPRTHVMWHLVAPRLAETFTVVVADLRGYGESSKPATPEHAPYSKWSASEDRGPGCSPPTRSASILRTAGPRGEAVTSTRGA